MRMWLGFVVKEWSRRKKQENKKKQENRGGKLERKESTEKGKDKAKTSWKKVVLDPRE